MRVRVRFAWAEESDQTLLRLAGISTVAHIIGLVLFSALPQFMQSPPPPRTTIAEIIPASALLPPAPPSPPAPAGPTPSERAEAARKALEPEPPPVPKPKPKPVKPKPSKPAPKDIPPLESKKPDKEPEPAEPPPSTEPATGESPSGGPPAAAPVGPGGISFGETVTAAGGIPTIGSSAFPYDYYRASLVAILQSHWRRPVAPGGLREPITCRVQFTILKSGIIESPRIAASSGNPSLDQSALRAVVSSNPLPPLPFQYGHTSVSAEVMFELTPD